MVRRRLGAWRTALRKRYFGLTGLTSLEEELRPYLSSLHGVVLNAGAGHRSVALRQPSLTTDFDETAPVDFLCDLHYVPLPDESVDSILSVAVLEHTRYPWVVVSEFRRILTPGGTLVLAVPFLQPEHGAPHDFYRFTLNGVRELLTAFGFQILAQVRVTRFPRVIAWPLWEKWRELTGLRLYAASFVVNRISRLTNERELRPLTAYAGSYTVACTGQKPPDTRVEMRPSVDVQTWAFVDPVTKEPLTRRPDGTLTSSAGATYVLVGGRPDLRPQGGLSQDDLAKWRS